MEGVFAMRISKGRVTVLLAAIVLSVFVAVPAWAAVSSTYTYYGTSSDLGTLPNTPTSPKLPGDPNNNYLEKALFSSQSPTENIITVNYTPGSDNVPTTVLGGIGQGTNDVKSNDIKLINGVVDRVFIGGFAYPGSTGSVSNNIVTVSGGRVGLAEAGEADGSYVHGGLSRGTGDVNGNIVTVTNAIIGRWVIGGQGNGTANGNKVTVSGNAQIGKGNDNASRGVEGGVVASGTNSPSNNYVSIEGDVKIGRSGGYVGYVGIYGGYGYSCGAEDNTVEITGGTIYVNNDPRTVVNGGQGDGSNGTVTGNEVIISGGTLEVPIGGGWTTKDTNSDGVTNNTVTISGGNISSPTIYGGRAGGGNATGNTVTISGGNIGEADIYGGYVKATSRTATGNTIIIKGNPTLDSEITLYGGFNEAGTGEVRTGNTLTIGTGPLSIKGVENFATYGFDVSKLDNGETALTVNDAVALGNNATVVIDASGFNAKTAASGYKVTLISASSISGTLSNATTTTTATATDSKGRATEWTIEAENGKLTATLADPGLFNDTGLDSVAGVTVSSPSGGSGWYSDPFTAGVSVANSKASITASDIAPSDTNATVYLCTNGNFNASANSISLAAGATTVVYFGILADNETDNDYYAVSVYRAASSGSGGDTGGGSGGGTGGSGGGTSGGDTNTDREPETGTETTPPAAVVELPEESVTVNATTNTATVAVPDTILTDNIQKALDLAAEAGGDAQATIELDLTKETASGVDVVKVDIFVTDLSEVAESEVENVRVATSIGQVTLNTAAINDLIANAGSGAQTVELAIEHKAPQDISLSTGQQAALSDAKVREVYDISLYVNSTKLNFNTDGKLTIGLPYTLASGETASGVWANYVSDNGAMQRMEEGRAYEGGLAIFKTSHLSVYALTYEAPASTTPENPSGSGSGGGSGCDAGFGALAGLLAIGVLGKAGKAGKSR
jgi:hypothetical protein